MQKLSQEEKLEIIKNKTRVGENQTNELIKTILGGIFVLPIVLIVLLPLLLLNLIYKKIKHTLAPRRRLNNKPEGKIIESIKPRQSRTYDLVLFGATGFTGRLAAEYLARHYGLTKKWAIAGRNKKNLQLIKEELVQIDEKLSSLDILIADSNNEQQLEAIVQDTRVVLTTVGPYEQHGSLLAMLCSSWGTDYCDITGEVSWVRQMIEKYDNIAAKTGARLVNCCGCDSIPWDLSTFALAEKLKEKDETLEKVEFFDEVSIQPSGGTLATLIHSLENPPPRSKLDFDPLLKVLGKNEKGTNALRPVIQKFLGYSNKINKWIGLWTLATGNACVVRRSNILLNYGPKVTYFEAKEYPNFYAGLNETFGIIALGIVLFNSWIRGLVFGRLLPLPGEGLSRADQLKGFGRITGIATGSKGTSITSEFTLPVDPGYKDTARMAVETALHLLESGENVRQGGFHTPASAGGNALIKRLVDTGSTMRFFNIK